MRQRAAIALALALQPRVLIADEPISFLDVTLQLQDPWRAERQLEENRFTLLLITHDLAAASTIADDVAVIYAGRIVEQGPLQQVFGRPKHPYTNALLRSHPSFGRGRRLEPVEGPSPSPLHLPAGCAFHPRCPEMLPCCCNAAPELLGAAGEHRVACYRFNTLGIKSIVEAVRA